MSDLKEALALAQEMIDVESLISDKEEELKELRERYRRVAEDELPQLMEEAGMQSLTLTDGRVLEIEASFHGSIPEANRAEAFAWLRKTGRDGIIKRAVVLEFGKGEDKKAQKYVAWLQKHYPDMPIKDNESVHPQTLKAFIRDMMEQGEELPSTFNVFRRTEAKIKHDKKAKAKAAKNKAPF